MHAGHAAGATGNVTNDNQSGSMLSVLQRGDFRHKPGIWLLGAIFALLPEGGFAQTGSGTNKAFDMKLLSLGTRARVGEKRVIGEDQPDSFQAYDVIARFQLPWARDFQSDWALDGHMLTSAGVLRGAGKTALVVSAIPMVALTWSERMLMDGGVGIFMKLTMYYTI